MSLPKYCWIVDLESLGRWNIKAITKTEDVEVFTAETSTESSHEQQPVSNPILLGCYPIFHINRIFLASPMIFHQLVTLRAWQLLTESETGSPHTSWSWTFQWGCRTLLQAAASATTLVHFFIGPLPKLLWWSMVIYGGKPIHSSHNILRVRNPWKLSRKASPVQTSPIYFWRLGLP